MQEGPPPPHKALLIDDDSTHAHRVIECLPAFGLGVELCSTVKQGIIKLSRREAEYELVVLNVSDASQPWLRLLQVLHEAAFQSGRAIGPLYLCVSTVRRDHLFELQVERMGARLVYEQ